MNTKINVTQACISKAKKILYITKRIGVIARGENCPVAQALKKQKIKFDNVGENFIDLSDVKFVHLPITVARFISDFDNMEPVKPFSFMLDVPLEFLPKSPSNK
jgi:hypothetical protein